MAAGKCLCGRERNLTVGVGYLSVRHNSLLLEHFKILFNGIELNTDNRCCSKLFSAGVGKCQLYLRYHILLGNAVFLLEKVKGVEKLCVHFSFLPRNLLRSFH